MAKCIGIMVTWRTYGTWLPGDGRGYVEKGGEVRSGSTNLYSHCASRLEHEPVRLSGDMKRCVNDAICECLEHQGVRVLAIAVCSDHVHIVVSDCEIGIGEVVAQCKVAGRKALKETGSGKKVWSSGYDRRFCFDEESLRARVKYVLEHDAG